MTNASDDNQTPDSDDGLTEAAKPQALDDERGAPSPAGEPTATVQPEATARIPKRIGNYHVKRVIASGGMGTVYEATQEKPRRTVALKLMKHGIASRSALRRFEYESQILARLRHPGIAQVYEAGTHRDDTGTVPYFAMEYIVGAKPITQYVDEKKLGTRERMGLFAQVCDAVQHGHQKGIIHRDLKPSNILVDANGQVKIIDFGVARSTDSDMAVTTLQTDIGQLIGTLQYMSPEQCEADPHNIDTRSDVYALGVVFYELLCGKLPYNVTRVAMHEATRIIREQHPTKPSALKKTLRGDVETIALKALEKDRERRYQTANELRRDIEHYLKGEPISARPPSVAYQLRIFARRHKPLTIAALAVVAALVAVTATSVAAYFKVSAERERAVAAELRTGEEAEKARSAAQIATKARKEAETERDRAERAEREARRQGEELKWAHYRSQLGSAQWAYSTGQTRQMWQALLSTIDLTPAWEWRYLRNLLDRSERVFRDFDSRIRSVALSADGTRLATGHVDGSILLWDTATGEHLRTLRGHLCGVVALAFSPDGSRLASGTLLYLGTLPESLKERNLRVWDVATGDQLAALGPPAASVDAVAFDVDGAMLVSGGDENRLTLWDASSFEQKRTWIAHKRTLMERLTFVTEEITCVVFSRDSRMIASGSTDETVRTWDAREGKPILTLGAHDDRIIGIDFDPDGRKIVSTARGGTIRIWDASSGEQLARIDVPDVSPTPAYFSGDGQHIVAGVGTDLLFWSADSGRLLKTFRGGMSDVRTLARSSDGSRIASVSRNSVRIWDPSAEHPTASYTHSDGVQAVAISRDGSRLYTYSGPVWRLHSEPQESRIDVWDLRTGTRVGQLPGHRDVITALALSSNDRFLLSGSGDGSLMVWDTESLAFLRTLGPKGGKTTERALHSILSMASSPDGRHVAVGTGPTGTFTGVLDRARLRRNSICMYDSRTGEVVRTFSGHEGRVTGVRFSRSGDRLVSIGRWDKTVRVWETDSGKQLLLLEHHGFVRDAIFLEEGKRVLTVSDGVYVWDAETGQLESSSLPIAEYELRCLALTPDGQRLAAGDSAGKIMLVDPATGDIVATLTGHTGAITSLAFSADGLSLVSGSLDRTTRVWQAPPVDESDIVDHLITQAWRLLDKNEEAPARPLLLKALEVYDTSKDDGVSIETVGRLALGLSELGEAADAITMRLLLLAEERAPKSRHRGNALFLQARELVRQGRLNESEQWFSRAVEILGASLQDDHPHVLRAKSELGGCLSALQRYDEAERLLVESCTGLRKQWGRQNRFTRQALQRVVALYEAWDKPEQAAQWRTKLPTANPAPGPNGQKP